MQDWNEIFQFFSEVTLEQYVLTLFHIFIFSYYFIAGGFFGQFRTVSEQSHQSHLLLPCNLFSLSFPFMLTQSSHWPPILGVCYSSQLTPFQDLEGNWSTQETYLVKGRMCKLHTAVLLVLGQLHCSSTVPIC